MDIITKDALRAEVETASNGKQTVIRTATGQPSYFNVIPAFKCEDVHPALGTGLFPAFIVNGVEKTEIFAGTYQALVQNGEAISLPGVNPTTRINFDAARAACIAAGPGFHMLTNWGWAAIYFWMMKNGYSEPRGNTNYGKSHSHPEESGTLCESGKILTGSGPDTWRHDGTPHGIADLVGNVWEWVDGLKLQIGKIVMPVDNAIATPESEWTDTGIVVDGKNNIQLADAISKRGWLSRPFKNVSLDDGVQAPELMYQSLLCPATDCAPSGHMWADNTENFEALPIRGGCWCGDSAAGLGALDLGDERSTVDSALGFRPAFIG